MLASFVDFVLSYTLFCLHLQGASVGLVKNMAMTACITCAGSPLAALRIIKAQEDFVPCVRGDSMDKMDIKEFAKRTPVMVNGDIVGAVKDHPIRLFELLKDSKRRGVLHIMTSVSMQTHQGIMVNTESGRCTRPLFVTDVASGGGLHVATLEKSVLAGLSWMQLVMGDKSIGLPPCVEYLDTDEVNSSMIAMQYSDLFARQKGANYPPKYTHCEIHPCLMLGVAASCIPFSDHNQSPRVCYQSSMCKQAIGIHLTNHHSRYDAVSHVLVAPEAPIVRTRTATILNNNEMPWGCNVVVAIACFTGYNQEDALIMNKSSVERGLFHTVCYKSHKELNLKNHSSGQEEVFCKVANTENRPFNYDKLGDSGFVPVNTFVETGDIIIGKVLPSKNGPPKDVSVAIKTNEHGVVDKVLSDVSNGEGYNFAKVCIRQTREPTVGDKFASRHAQKGTVGILYDSWDMPFMENGVVPDIIINPNCIPRYGFNSAQLSPFSSRQQH
jgi:DNA-directed RNA polymerase II subunit RPB2